MADPDLLRERARALRLTNKQIAKLAGLDPNTIGRLFAREAKVLHSTVTKVADVIAAEETAQRRRLAAAEPVQVAS